MADINGLKDKLFGAFGSIADKTKDLAEKAADKTKDLAEKAADKTKAMSRIAKLTMDINGEKDAIKKAYTEIGKLYYETHKDDPDGFFVQLCDEISLAKDSIAAKEAEIAELKASISTGDDDGAIEVDFEEVVSEAEAEAVDTADVVVEVVEEAAETAEEVAEEVVEAAEEAVEEVIEAAEEVAEAAEEKSEE